MTTFNWQGKEYKIVPDNDPANPCGVCCFMTNMDHRCTREGMYYPDGTLVQPCNEGDHHYEEVAG